MLEQIIAISTSAPSLLGRAPDFKIGLVMLVGVVMVVVLVGVVLLLAGGDSAGGNAAACWR